MNGKKIDLLDDILLPAGFISLMAFGIWVLIMCGWVIFKLIYSI